MCVLSEMEVEVVRMRSRDSGDLNRVILGILVGKGMKKKKKNRDELELRI